MLLVFAALGLRLWANTQMNRLNGPQQITVLDGELLISVGDTVLRTTTDGTVRGEYPLQALGMPDALTDMQALDDGSVLLAASRPALLRRCRLDPLECETLAEGDALPGGQAYKLAMDLEGNRLFVADSNGHRLLMATDLARPEPLPLSLDQRPRFPNNLYIDRERDLLWVADTNHHRLAAYRIDGSDGQTVESIVVDEHPMARHGRVWPTAFAFDDMGMAWVLNGDNGLVDADLLGFQPDGTPLARAALPDDADPVFIVHLNGELFVTDLRRVTVYRVALRDMAVSELGGTFADRIAERRGERERYAELSQAGLWSLVAIIVLGFVVAGTSLKEKLGTRSTDAPFPEKTSSGPPIPHRIAPLLPADRFSGVTWIEPDPKAMRRIRLMMVSGIAMLLIGIPLIVAIFWMAGSADLLSNREKRWVLLTMGVPILMMLGLFWFARQSLATRIGIRGGIIYLRDHRGQAVQIPPEVAVYTRHGIAHGPITIVLADGHNRPLYDPEVFLTRIQPILKRARYLGSINFLIYQIQHKQPMGIFSVAAPLLGLFAIYAAYRWL
ncbi:MAG: hypothetical protein RBT51_11280 [Ectothiorhodospiraceae bacterium]|nr:hypothetical protein [Ectothiorhodospiraceae bacterium]